MKLPPRPLAAHVAAALARTAQPKKAAPAANGPWRAAPHVRAAIDRGLQCKPAPAAPGRAAHVQAAIGASFRGSAAPTPPRLELPVAQARPIAPPPPFPPTPERAPAPPHAPAPGRGVVQRMEWQTTSGAVETRAPKKGFKYPWIWAPDLTLNIAGIKVPPHEIHTKSVTPKKGTKGNKLWASYTLVGVRGQRVTAQSVVIESGPVLGPVEAKLSGIGKEGHTEQQIGKAILEALEVPLTAPTDDDEALEAIIIEIHQTFTPCSGEAGCSRYLESQIMDAIDADTRVPTLVLRASAEHVYESQTVPTYPGLVPWREREIIPDWGRRELEGEIVVVHNQVWK